MTSNNEPLTEAEVQKLGDFFHCTGYTDWVKDQVACYVSQGAWSNVRNWLHKDCTKAPLPMTDSTELLRRYHVIRVSSSWGLPGETELITELFNTGQHDTIVELVNAVYDRHARKFSAKAEAIISPKPSQ